MQFPGSYIHVLKMWFWFGSKKRRCNANICFSRFTESLYSSWPIYWFVKPVLPLSSLGSKREKRWLPNPPRVHYVGLFPVSSFHQLDDQNIFSYSSSRRGEKGTNAISEISFSLFFPHHSPSGMRGGRMNRGIFNIRLNWLILAFFLDSDMYSIHLGFTRPPAIEASH